MPRAVRGRRRPVVRIDDLDRDVVVADEVAQPLGDLVEDRPRVERRQDRLGDREELALVDELPLERVATARAAARVASALAIAWAAKLA